MVKITIEEEGQEPKVLEVEAAVVVASGTIVEEGIPMDFVNVGTYSLNSVMATIDSVINKVLPDLTDIGNSIQEETDAQDCGCCNG